MGVNEFDAQDKLEERDALNLEIEKKQAKLKKLRNLLSLKESKDIQKFIECFMFQEYQDVGKIHDGELDTNKNFWLKGRAYQLRKQLNWQKALEKDIDKIKKELANLKACLEGNKPEHEPE